MYSGSKYIIQGCAFVYSKEVRKNKKYNIKYIYTVNRDNTSYMKFRYQLYIL